MKSNLLRDIREQDKRKLKLKLNNIMGERVKIFKREKKLQRWKDLRERLERGGHSK